MQTAVGEGQSHLESLVLEDSLDGGIFPRGRELGLKHYAERAITDNLAVGILQLSGLSSNTILHFLPHDLYRGELATGIM